MVTEKGKVGPSMVLTSLKDVKDLKEDENV
jgi:hypothetical protein